MPLPDAATGAYGMVMTREGRCLPVADYQVTAMLRVSVPERGRGDPVLGMGH